jgi:hypothetical protein
MNEGDFENIREGTISFADWDVILLWILQWK